MVHLDVSARNRGSSRSEVHKPVWSDRGHGDELLLRVQEGLRGRRANPYRKTLPEHGGTAAFFKRPRRAEDLMGLHLLTNEHIFSVAETIELDWIDYENFVTDMLADRQFIEDNAHLCQTE